VILVDTDVLIAHLRGHPAARDWLRTAREQGILSASAVTLTELTGGMRSAERREVTRLLSALRLRPVTVAIARQAGMFMRSYRASHSGIGLGDYLVAATAGVLGLELATLNVRHFPMFEDLQPPFRW
jgi:predicted nucleic acid-binding protein